MLTPADTVVVRQVIDAVREGVVALTPAAKHVLDLAARQCQVEAVTGFVLLIFVWLCTIGAFMGMRFEWGGYDLEEPLSIIGIIGLIVSFATTIIVTCHFLPVLLNPEWAAIAKLAEMVK